MKKWIIALVVIVVLGAVAAFDYASPLWTLKNLQTAARDNDSDTVAAHVDFETLRADLKQEIRARVNEGGDGIANALGDAFIDPLVEAVVTPRSIRTVFDARQSGAAQTAGALALPNLGSGDPTMARTGLNSFTVTAPNGNGTLVFTRPFPFMTWRLSGVDLPSAPPPPTAQPET